MTAARPFGLLILVALPEAAQSVVGTQAGTLQFTTGEVTLDGRPARVTATSFPSWKDGQILRTGRGRVEVLLAPGTFLRMGSQSSLRMENSSLIDTRIELRRGRALVEVVEGVKNGRTTLEHAGTATELKRHGLYRLDADRRQVQVYGGEAEVQAGGRKASAGRGRAIQLDDSLTVSKFNPKQGDGLFQWAARRSFYWFRASPQTWSRPSDWEITVTGWFWNPNFDIRFFNAKAASRYRRMQQQQDTEKATSDELKKYDP